MTRLLLVAAVVCFDAALWLPCLSESATPDGTVYSGAHLIFVAVGSLFGLVSSGWAAQPTLEAWWLVPLANIVFLAAPWIWTSHPRSAFADRSVTAMKLATGVLGVWAIGNFILAHTGLWAEPTVQAILSLVPGTTLQLEIGSFAWMASMLLVTAALIRRRASQQRLLERWMERPGALELSEPTSDELSAIPAGVRDLVIDAYRLRLEFDALGPIDGWRVRLVGDWITRLCDLHPEDYAFLAQRNVWPQQLTLALTPDSQSQPSRHDDRLAELLRMDEALHCFVSAVLRPPTAAYR